MLVAVLTGGGDCPGLNAAIRAVVRRSEQHGWSVLGIRNGWAGLLGGSVEPLTDFSVSGILPKGGTILGTSRTNPFKEQESIQRCLENFRKFGIGSLIAIGGEDTLGVAQRFFERGLSVVGIPKTIDNDLGKTDYTFGFDTALSIATEAIDRLHTTAEAHSRVMVVEVMGRHSGWIATFAGLAGGADGILIPERPFDIEEVCDIVRRRAKRGRAFSIIVVAEGAKPKDGSVVVQSTTTDEFGHPRLGGIGTWVGAEIEKRTSIETRVTMLGHVQRGGSPTPFDRILATRFGVAAADLVKESKWGYMVGIQGTRIVRFPIVEALNQRKEVDPELWASAEVFFG